MSHSDTERDETFPLATTEEMLLALPVADAIAEAKMPESWHYAQIFFVKAVQAESNGDIESGKTWRLLDALCRVDMRPDKDNLVHRPIQMIRSNGSSTWQKQ